MSDEDDVSRRMLKLLESNAGREVLSRQASDYLRAELDLERAVHRLTPLGSFIDQEDHAAFQDQARRELRPLMHELRTDRLCIQCRGPRYRPKTSGLCRLCWEDAAR